MKRLASLAAFGLSIGCSNGETTHHTTHEPAEAGAVEEGCDGRGRALEGLLVSSEGDAGGVATLEFLAGEPMPPIVGNNSWLFGLEVGGKPLPDLAAAITVTPFMPDHGHGTPTKVNVVEEEPGEYRFEPVHLRMAGFWEIRVELESEVRVADWVFGVCVE